MPGSDCDGDKMVASTSKCFGHSGGWTTCGGCHDLWGTAPISQHFA
jgi:hypothetical protein